MSIMSLQRNEIPIETIVHKQNTKGLHYWDRNETRYNPHAMTAIPFNINQYDNENDNN